MAHPNARLSVFGRQLLASRVLVQRWPAAEVAEQLGVSRATVYIPHLARPGTAGRSRHLRSTATYRSIRTVNPCHLASCQTHDAYPAFESYQMLGGQRIPLLLYRETLLGPVGLFVTSREETDYHFPTSSDL